MPAEEAAIWQFCSELREKRNVSDATLETAIRLFGERGVGLVAIRVGEGFGVLLVVHVAESLEEQQREDELLVVPRVDRPP